jgi:hypothetical protein
MAKAHVGTGWTVSACLRVRYRHDHAWPTGGFLIDERGVIASRGIAGTKQSLGYILTRAGSEPERALEEEPISGADRDIPAETLASLPSSNSKEVHHV